MDGGACRAVLDRVQRVQELVTEVLLEVGLDDAAAAVQLQPDVLDDRQGARVGTHGVAGQPFDASLARCDREVADQPGADAAALLVVLDQRGEVRHRRVVAMSFVAGHPHDRLVLVPSERRHQGVLALRIEVDELVDVALVQLGAVRQPRPPCPQRGASPHGQQAAGVVRPDLTQPDSGAVRQRVRDRVGHGCVGPGVGAGPPRMPRPGPRRTARVSRCGAGSSCRRPAARLRGRPARTGGAA